MEEVEQIKSAINKLLAFKKDTNGPAFQKAWVNFLTATCFEMWMLLVDKIQSDLATLYSYLSSEGHREKALLVCRILVDTRPESVSNLCLLGHAYRDVGRLEEAAECYARAAEWRPSSPQLRRVDYLSCQVEVEIQLCRYDAAFGCLSKGFSYLNEFESGTEGVEEARERLRDLLARVSVQT